MRSTFLIPIIVWLPRGYSLTIFTPKRMLEERVPGWTGRIERYVQVVCDGEILEDTSIDIAIEDGQIVSDWPEEYCCSIGMRDDWPRDGGYLEFGIRSIGETPAFTSKKLPGFYNLFVGQGVKSFVTCQTWKFGSPQVISQIASIGMYVDAYPVIHYDLDQDMGDSLVLINPYLKPVLAQLIAEGIGKLRRHRIPPQSARMIDLKQILQGDARSWSGQIQLTANNRVVTQIVKHSIKDPDRITTVEHLDPFRGDSTHQPAFQWLRNAVGGWINSKRS